MLGFRYSYFYNISFNTEHIPFRLNDVIHLIPQDPRNFAHPSIVLSYFYFTVLIFRGIPISLATPLMTLYASYVTLRVYPSLFD